MCSANNSFLFCHDSSIPASPFCWATVNSWIACYLCIASKNFQTSGLFICSIDSKPLWKPWVLGDSDTDLRSLYTLLDASLQHAVQKNNECPNKLKFPSQPWFERCTPNLKRFWCRQVKTDPLPFVSVQFFPKFFPCKKLFPFIRILSSLCRDPGNWSTNERTCFRETTIQLIFQGNKSNPKPINQPVLSKTPFIIFLLRSVLKLQEQVHNERKIRFEPSCLQLKKRAKQDYQKFSMVTLSLSGLQKWKWQNFCQLLDKNNLKSFFLPWNSDKLNGIEETASLLMQSIFSTNATTIER